MPSLPTKQTNCLDLVIPFLQWLCGNVADSRNSISGFFAGNLHFVFVYTIHAQFHKKVPLLSPFCTKFFITP